MFRTRGKPGDKWNSDALKQEKELAALIHINQVKKDGIVPKLKLDNFDSFETRAPLIPKKLRVNGKVHEVKVKNVPTQVNPALYGKLRKTVPTTAVSIPYKDKWESSQLQPKSSVNLVEELHKKYQNIMKGEEQVMGISPRAIEDRTVLERQLEGASLEVDLGNEQLEKIKQIIEASKKCNKVRFGTNNFLYNVERDRACKEPVAKPPIEKKGKLLLTLNNVQQRMQNMQLKFFNGPNTRYKSVKNVYPKMSKKISNVANTAINTEENSEVEVEKGVLSTLVLDDFVNELSKKEEVSKTDDYSMQTIPRTSDYKSSLQNAVFQSNYLTKEFDVDYKNFDNFKDFTFMEKLESNFKQRPFVNAKSSKSFLPVFDSLKHTLYCTSGD